MWQGAKAAAGSFSEKHKAAQTVLDRLPVSRRRHTWPVISAGMAPCLICDKELCETTRQKVLFLPCNS